MENLYVNVIITDKPTVLQKIILLLRDFPEIRNSYDLIAEKYVAVYGPFSCKRISFDRKVSHIQNELGIFPPSDAVKKLREEIRNKKMLETRAKKTVFKSVKKFFKNILGTRKN